MRAYSIKLNGSNFIVFSAKKRKENTLINQAMRVHHPHTKGARRQEMLHDAKVSELEVMDGVAKISVRNFELV